MKGDERTRRQHAREVRQAKRKAEHDAAAPVQAGRQTVEGKVMKMKEVKAFRFNRWSPEIKWKVLIVLDGGAKVWCDRFGNLKRVIVSASQRSSSSRRTTQSSGSSSVPEYWSRLRESNSGPSDYESLALPTELSRL